jgi:hypothetical protein
MIVRDYYCKGDSVVIVGEKEVPVMDGLGACQSDVNSSLYGFGAVSGCRQRPGKGTR